MKSVKKIVTHFIPLIGGMGYAFYFAMKYS